jgi:hypothetical protein
MQYYVLLETLTDQQVLDEVERRLLYPGVTEHELNQLLNCASRDDWRTAKRLLINIGRVYLGKIIQ